MPIANPFKKSDRDAVSLDELVAKRADASNARDAALQERAELQSKRIALATEGTDPVAVNAASSRIHALSDSIELAEQVLAQFDARIAPLQAQADQRVRDEQSAAARLMWTASHDRATAAARAVHDALDRVCQELEAKFATLDRANAALVESAQAVVNSGGQASFEPVSPLGADASPFMEYVFATLRELPKRIADAKANHEALLRSNAQDKEFRAKREAQQLEEYRTSHPVAS